KQGGAYHVQYVGGSRRYTLSHLPESSFVRFPTRRLRDAFVVYVNREVSLLSSAGLLDAYGRVVPDDPDGTQTVDNVRWFAAERYGGQQHGGGARCGYDGALQVKGIGCNPLVARDVPERYRTGGISLSEGLIESVMDRVLYHALPNRV